MVLAICATSLPRELVFACCLHPLNSTAHGQKARPRHLIQDRMRWRRIHQTDRKLLTQTFNRALRLLVCSSNTSSHRIQKYKYHAWESAISCILIQMEATFMLLYTISSFRRLAVFAWHFSILLTKYDRPCFSLSRGRPFDLVFSIPFFPSYFLLLLTYLP